MKVIYAGSFNLFHAGHYYVYNKACNMFGRDNVYLCVAINKSKTIDPDFIKWTLNPITPNVIVAEGLVTDLNPDVLIRGLRDAIDLSSEMTMADWNEKLGCGTIFIPCTGDLRHLSSSALRELIAHKVNIDVNIPSQTYISFKRWETGILPKRKLFCGKIAIGKSTYLKYLDEETLVDQTKSIPDNFVGDCDKLIWQFFDPSDKIFIKNQLTKIINSGNPLGYEAVLYEMSKKIKWNRLLSDEYINYEASSLGQWLKYIPIDILCKFQIIELEIDLTERLKRIKSRGLSIEDVNKFDQFYKSPYFVDELIDIGEIV